MGHLSRTLASAAAPLSFLLLACAAEPEEEAAPGAIAPAQPDTSRMYMVRLDGLRRPDLVGSAGFVPRGEETFVVAGLRGTSDGGVLQGHIHQGESCDAPGDPVHPLREIRVGGDGTGRTSTTIPATISTVFDGNHLIVYHEEGGQPGETVLCGDIPVLVPLEGEPLPPGG